MVLHAKIEKVEFVSVRFKLQDTGDAPLKMVLNFRSDGKKTTKTCIRRAEPALLCADKNIAVSKYPQLVKSTW